MVQTLVASEEPLASSPLRRATDRRRRRPAGNQHSNRVEQTHGVAPETRPRLATTQTRDRRRRRRVCDRPQAKTKGALPAGLQRAKGAHAACVGARCAAAITRLNAVLSSGAGKETGAMLADAEAEIDAAGKNFEPLPPQVCRRARVRRRTVETWG